MDADRKLADAFKSVIAAFVASARKSAFPKEICNEYKKLWEAEPPWRSLGFPDELSFLLEAGFRKGPDGRLSYESQESSHVQEMIDRQKPKARKPGAPPPRNAYRPVLPSVARPAPGASYIGVNDLSSAPSPSLEFSSDRELEAYCFKVFPPVFRYQLRLKLRECGEGCSPEAFVEYFNRSNFEKFKVPKDLEFKGLTMMQFFRGLTDVFNVSEENGVLRIFPALTSSLSSNTLGGAPGMWKPSGGDWMQRSPAVSHSTSASSQSLLTVTDMIAFFKQAQGLLAGQEVKMEKYFDKVVDIGGNEADEWLKMRRFTAASFATFAKEKLGPSIEVDVARETVRIRSAPPRTERPPVPPVSSNEQFVSGHEPFSDAYTKRRLACGPAYIDIVVNSFGPDTPNFYFTRVEDSQLRLELMKRLRTLEQKPLPRGLMKPGSACIASCSENKKFYRASIRRVEIDFVDVYLVDFGDTLRVRETHLFEIPDEFFEESVLALPATLANVKPIGGKANFELKELQGINLELDSSTLKAAILSFDADKHRYRVDLGTTARALERANLLVCVAEEPVPSVTNSFHSMRIQNNGTQQTVVSTIARQATTARMNGHAARYDASELRAENRVLPNCETVLVVHRNSERFVLASDISRVLGLAKNSFLATLEKCCIAVTDTWELTPEEMQQLEASDYNIESGTDNLMIPVVSVAPLIRAYLWAEGKSLENEKNVLKAFEKMAN